MKNYLLKLTRRDRSKMTGLGVLTLLAFGVCYVLFWMGGRRHVAVGFIAALSVLAAIGAMLGISEWAHLPDGDGLRLTEDQRDKAIIRVSRYGWMIAVTQLSALVAGTIFGISVRDGIMLALGALCGGALGFVYWMIGKACDPV